MTIHSHRKLFLALLTSLLVAAVQGLRHLKAEQSCEVPEMASAFERYVQKAFRPGEEVWPVFSIKRLTESPEFNIAAA